MGTSSSYIAPQGPAFTIAGIDLTARKDVELFTPASKFMCTAIYTVITASTGLGIDAVLSIGVTPPNYNDIVKVITITPMRTYQTTSNAAAPIDGGTGLKLRVGTPSDAQVLTATIYVYGSYID